MNWKILFIMALPMLFVHNMAIGANSESNLTKTTNAPPAPFSKYVREENQVGFGQAEGVLAWVGVAETTTGELQATIAGTKYAQFRFIIQNIGNTPINVSSPRIRALLNNGTIKKAFEGEMWPSGRMWLGPDVIEVNGKDVSLERYSSITLKQAEHAVVSAAFRIENVSRIKSAVSKVKAFDIPVVVIGKKSITIKVKRDRKY